MRKLASVQKILSVDPHPNADTLDIATIEGWHCIVKKGDFNAGDLCIFFEVDSVLPDTNPVFAFLEKYHYRIRTQKLRGFISQGLCMPVSLIPDELVEEGSDVTDVLGVTKYEPPIHESLRGLVKGNFPAFMHKTDEIRVQNIQGVLNRYKGENFTISEKLDGMSFTCYLHDNEFGICSRNMDLKPDENNSMWKTARSYDYESILRHYYEMHGVELAFQGEIIGYNIAKNPYKLPSGEHRIYLFNIFDITNQKYWSNVEVLKFCLENCILMVPIIDMEFQLITDIDALSDMADGKSMINHDVRREGLVFRPIKEMYDYEIGRLSFKSVSKEYLLKHDS